MPYDFDRVYDELRAVARQRLAAGMGGASLQATALVHEVWLRLAGADATARDTQHLFATAAQAMRWILVDRARRRGLAGRESLHAEEVPERDAGADDFEARRVLALDAALTRLEASHPRKAQVVLHRHFGGLSVEETARALDLSTATVKREWQFARAWLARDLERQDGAPERPQHGTPPA